MFGQNKVLKMVARAVEWIANDESGSDARTPDRGIREVMSLTRAQRFKLCIHIQHSKQHTGRMLKQKERVLFGGEK